MHMNMSTIDKKKHKGGIDEAIIIKFNIFKMQDLMINKNKKIKTLELEVKQLRVVKVISSKPCQSGRIKKK